MAARGRPPSPALLEALQLVREGNPVEAASKAAGIGKQCVWVILAKHKDAFSIVADRAAAALEAYGRSEVGNAIDLCKREVVVVDG